MRPADRFHVASERLGEALAHVLRIGPQPADQGEVTLLRARRERPNGRRAGKTGDEVASPHGCCPRAEDNTLAHHLAATVQCSTTKGLMSALCQKQTSAALLDHVVGSHE